MSGAAFVCKHCGGGDIFVNVTVSGWQEGYVAQGSNGPYFEQDGRVEVDTYDADIEAYVCNACRREARRLTDLVVAAPADGDEPIAACGRCDHGRAEHGDEKPCRDDRFTRSPMPCGHEGCDCHDYYDRAFAESEVAA